MFKISKIQVRLDTQKEIYDFVNLASSIDVPVYLEDGTGFRANAKSIMGVMYGTVEFSHLYVLSEYDKLETKFNKFII